MIVVDFGGRLGNQMFQYAFYKKYKMLVDDVYMNISSIYRKHSNIVDVFPSIIQYYPQAEKLAQKFREKDFKKRKSFSSKFIINYFH